MQAKADLTWLRYSFELNSLSSYAERKDSADAAKFQALADKLKAAATYDEIADVDTEMHDLIFDIESNKLFRFLHSSIMTLYKENIRFANAENIPWYKTSLEASKEYIFDLLDAIISQDMPRIKPALSRHYNWTIDEINDKYSDFINNLRIANEGKKNI